MKNISFFALLFTFFSTLSQTIFAQDVTAKNKATIQKAYDALNRKDWAGFAAQCAPGFTDVNVGPAPAVGIDAALDLYKQFQSGFPDFMVKINEITPVSPTRFLLRVTVTGTNTGSFMMLPPTGKSIRFDDADVVELDANGKCISHTITNAGEPLRQIGYGSLLNPNTQVVIAVYEKFGKGDVQGILAGSSNDVVFDIHDRVFDSKPRTFKGKAGVAQFFQELGIKFQYTKFQPVRFVADGDDVFALIDAAYKHIPSGNMYTSIYTHHFKVVNGQVTYFRGLDDFQTSVPEEMNKQAALKIMEKLGQRNLDAVAASFAADTRFHGWAPQALDVNGYKQAMSDILAAFPDARFVVEDVIAEGDKVVVRHRFEGTHTGAAFQGVPTSNKKAVASATVTFQFKEHKTRELWLNADFMGLMMQIGGVPSGK